jgi:topoisomerase-4 subunit B
VPKNNEQSMANDLLSAANAAPDTAYDAHSIEVLEGLEPVRKRPGMYVGGTDERALHHLAAEVLDNAMDEAVAGHASRIEVTLHEDGSLTIRDNGRGIPVDPHPKFPRKSALEVILCTLHAGGKFSGKAYQTSGGLHGVGVSVVNALSDRLRVEVARDRTLYAQEFARGLPQGKLAEIGPAPNRRGTTVTFHPDPEISPPTGSARRGCFPWPGPRPICIPGSKSAGPAPSPMAMCRPRRGSTSPAVWPIIWARC